MQRTLCSGSVAARFDVSEHAVDHRSCDDVPSTEQLVAALQNPLGLPLIHECVVPGDRVVIVVDPETPQMADVITQVWEQFQAAGGEELDATLLLPADHQRHDWKNLLDELPVHVRTQIAAHVHDPTDIKQRSYLASSAAGERIYLSHYLTDADLIVTIGVIAFDGLLGHRGTTSAIYPAYSDVEAMATIRMLGHPEFTPDDKRPLRELVDEIGWLLGTQFAVQIVPGADEGIAGAFCGAPDQVMATGQQLLNQRWRLRNVTQADLAIVSIPGISPIAWKHLGAALETASRFVDDNGRIAVVADLPDNAGTGIDMLRRCNDPEELLNPLRRQPTEDAFEVTQIINVLLRNRVYLLSRLKPAFVDDLGMLPLANEAELQRLIGSAESVVVIPNANYACAQIIQESRS